MNNDRSYGMKRGKCTEEKGVRKLPEEGRREWNLRGSVGEAFSIRRK